jgi:serine/threonine-protein kinase
MWCIASALDGLAWAHAARHPLTNVPLGIVHRDISPNNLMASRHGVVRVIDFGLALSSVREARTELGLVLGKPGYMSPEHARGDPVDPAGDVYAAGIVLYELLTGERYYGLTPRDRQRLLAAGGVWRAPLSADVDAVTNGLFSAMVHPEAGQRPTAVQARDVLLALIAERGGVDDATRDLGALVVQWGAAELARFDDARARARDLVRPPIEDDATTISLAVSESRAVQALLGSPPPNITRAAAPGPRRMRQASPSLFATTEVRPAAGSLEEARGEARTIAMRLVDVGREAATIDMRLHNTRPDTPLRDVTPEVAPGTSERETTSATPSTPSPPATPPTRAASDVRPATPRTTLALPAVMVAPRTMPRPVVALIGVVALGAGIAIGVAWSSRPAQPPPLPLASLPAPVPATTPTTLTMVPPPSPQTATSTATDTPVTAPSTSATEAPAHPQRPVMTVPQPDALFQRVQHLAQCSHPCGRLFQAPARDGVATLSPDRRTALEQLASNCEAKCR